MLDSWNDGQTKTAILDFIESVTTAGDGFVPAEERVAVFDNDGTLWCEKPHYVQAEFLMRSRDETGEPAVEPEAAGSDDAPGTTKRARMAQFLDRLPDVAAGLSDVLRGITTEQFEVLVRQFFDTAVHPTLGVPYTQLAYRPMIELLQLLEANDFRIYICTGGGRDFIRVVSKEMYGVPRDRVIGSAGKLEYRDGDIYRKKGLELPIAEGPGKPVHIWKRTGRKPLFACGNSDGDLEMLQIAKFGLLIHHDDAEREFAYDRKAEEVLAQAPTRDWTVVSMKDDFQTIF